VPQGLELIRAGHEIGLAVQLQEHADLTVGVDVGEDQSLARGPADLLRRLRQPLLPKPVDGLLQIAAALGQRLLAVQNARTGAGAQILDSLHVESHT